MHGILFPPPSPDERAQWRANLREWRRVTRALMRYDGSSYERPEFRWMARTFCVGFVMMFDTQFYDPATKRYQINALLDAAQAEFGGYDAIVLWHAYPRIGLDDRSQFDFYLDTQGGLDSLRELVNHCHRRGVRVYVDYNPWDRSTRPEGVSDADALASLVKAIDADAIFLDTLARAADGLREKLDSARPGVVLESEHLLPIEDIEIHHASWAQGIPSGDIPGVLRNRWFEQRHMQHRIKRWQRNHTEELHLAWMNGAGVVVWENVFGSDFRWSPRDKSILRAMLPIQRRYPDIFTEGEWTPLIETANEVIAASLWEHDGLRLWTGCNLSESAYEGALFAVDNPTPSLTHYDLVRGEQLNLAIRDGIPHLSTTLPPRGITAILTGDKRHFDDDFNAFLASQRALAQRADFDRTPPTTIEVLTPIERTASYKPDALPSDMTLVPGRTFDLRVQFQVRECGFYGYGVNGSPALDLRYRNLHHVETAVRPVQIRDFAIDLTPVTNAQYAAFLQATGYRPHDPARFLDDWTNGTLPTALEDHPVVYVDLDDARVYARWAGKRLPTEEEWQHAAQSFETRVYPWGDDYRPVLCNHGASGTTTPVRAYPDGCSPFGCYDMCGNVWEMTESERTNGRTRFCILKGGSFYRAGGSEWYFDGGPQPNAFSAKMILSWARLDRCATVGFRCAADVAE